MTIRGQNGKNYPWQPGQDPDGPKPYQEPAHRDHPNLGTRLATLLHQLLLTRTRQLSLGDHGTAGSSNRVKNVVFVAT